MSICSLGENLELSLPGRQGLWSNLLRATTADENTKVAVLEATTELLERLIEANDIDKDTVAAAFFTTTLDLNAEFPAVAARQLGWEYVALMCGHEMAVPNAVQMCVRIMLLVNTEMSAQEISNVYLRGAANLRPEGNDEA